jgi:ChrR-like protein with cupin domain
MIWSGRISGERAQRNIKGELMNVPTRLLVLVALAVLPLVPAAYGADLDRSAVDFKTPAEIKWVRNAAGTNEQAVLFGDPSKPGPYVVRLKWLPGNMSRPHFHPNDRFFVVISGTWWMGTGETFDPASTVPAPAGSYVIHYGGKVHYDGAKDEETVIQVWGMGPATSTPAGTR